MGSSVAYSPIRRRQEPRAAGKECGCQAEDSAMNKGIPSGAL